MRNTKFSRIAVFTLSCFLFAAISSCNGGRTANVATDSSGVKDNGNGRAAKNQQAQSSGPGDSASGLHRTDSSRVVHGGELIKGKNGSTNPKK